MARRTVGLWETRARSPAYYYSNTGDRLMYAAKDLDHEGVARWVRSAPRVEYLIP